MKRMEFQVAVVGLLLVAGSVMAPAQIDTKQAQEDWKALAPLCEQYQARFQSESEIKKRAATFRAEWEAWKKEFEPIRATFRERYGDQARLVAEAFANVEKPAGVKLDAWQAANIAYLIDFEAEQKKFAGWIEGWAREALRVATHIKAEDREKLERKLKRADDAVHYFKLVKEWDPAGSYDEPLKQAEALVQECLPEWKKTLTELKWPGHNPDFGGPGKPDELAAAALEFLRKHPTWSKPEYDDEHTPLAACVEGKSWEVYKKAPLTEQPTQYSLDVLVVFAGRQDPDLVYAYHMVLYTREEAGVKPELPFHFANSKQYACFRMLKSNVPAK
jgi:uncharacterized protein involved in high-affinity Fe2+ transport